MIDRQEFCSLQQEVQELRDLVEALKAENYRLSDPQPIKAVPSPPRLERSAPKKKSPSQTGPTTGTAHGKRTAR